MKTKTHVKIVKTFKADPEFLDRVKAFAEKSKRNFSEIIRFALVEYMERHNGNHRNKV